MSKEGAMRTHAIFTRDRLEDNLTVTKRMIQKMAEAVTGSNMATPEDTLEVLTNLGTPASQVKQERLRVLMQEVAQQEVSLEEINSRLPAKSQGRNYCCKPCRSSHGVDGQESCKKRKVHLGETYRDLKI